jgi:SsrA-binding protein
LTEQPKKPLVEKTVAINRRARHEFHILDTVECGVVLFGYEVKSIRQGRLNLADAYATVRDHELFVENMHISPYSHGDTRIIDPLRSRKLLLHRRQIDQLFAKMREQGLTLVPLKVYFKGPNIKIEVGLAKGKKLHDKRQDIAERDANREMARAVRDKGGRNRRDGD